jgi:hypothetical protein
MAKLLLFLLSSVLPLIRLINALTNDQLVLDSDSSDKGVLKVRQE